MKMTKRLAAIAATAVMAMTSAVGMSASAKNVTNDDVNHPYNFLSYSNSYTGSFSKLNAQVYAGTLSATVADYDGSWKLVSYITYGERNGSYYTMADKYDSGWSASISCSNTQVTSETAKRVYDGVMRLTSEPTSAKVDVFKITYLK